MPLLMRQDRHIPLRDPTLTQHLYTIATLKAPMRNAGKAKANIAIHEKHPTIIGHSTPIHPGITGQQPGETQNLSTTPASDKSLPKPEFYSVGDATFCAPPPVTTTACRPW